MSFVRASFAARSAFANARRYSTAPSAGKSSNLPYVLIGAGTAGLAGYLYLNGSEKAQAAAKPKISDKSPLDPQNFVDFKLKKVEPYNHNTAKFIFELPPDTASLLPIASCVIVKSSPDSPAPLVDAKGKPDIRPYTPISPSDLPGELTFLVKKYDEGKMSKYIHEMKLGDKLSIKGPIPKFDYKINQFDEVGMIAGGSGITPMYQILDYALKDPSNKTRFTLIFANVTEKDILLKEEFDALASKFPKTFNVVYTVDKAEQGWKGPTGYVNQELVMQHLPPANLGEKAKIFVCGPPGQVAALAGKKEGMKQGALGGVLKDLGYNEDQVFKF
ncbi:cytochrome-b5 reductase [Lentinus tigrinus ALCF2SS1-7]|uniref:cytochrome-b5 reductase n=1 Tax=Lentinus tigrinus ALCF2SS1-6 TaxID=1328759 RepID=A0A5C2RUV6_9APHY|nr:cytochrome-b5 reductase [Lentinus tigrinus ALCF2SS1-6]RPD69318.1 cytochrome-b5 reductase [Lentinus tigrinus ALCF2SS1-7]